MAVFLNNICLPILSLTFILYPTFCDISIEGLSPRDYDLLSFDPDASCEDHEPVLCGVDKQPPTLQNQDVIDEKCEGLQCPSQTDSSCFPKTFTPSDITYQFVLESKGMENPAFKYRFSWEPLPDDCHVEYYLALYNEKEPKEDTCSKFIEDSSNCKHRNYTKLNTSDVYKDFSSFKMEFSINDVNTKKHTRHFKLIAYPVYEWPTVTFQIPSNCADQHSSYYKYYNADGCSTCTACTVDKTPPQNFSVQYSDNGFTTNVSWTLSATATRYYLHINSTDKMYLFWLEKTVSQVTVTNMEVNVLYNFWLEQFSCGCSNPTYANSSEHVPIVKSKTLSQTSYTQTEVSESSTLLPTHSFESVTPHTSIDGVWSPSPFPSPMPMNKNRTNSNAYYATFTLLAIPIILIIVLVTAFVVVVKLKRSGSKYFLGPMVGPCPGPTGTINTELPIKVMLMYSTETKEKRLLEILTFLDHDLGSFHEEDGSRLFEIHKYDTSMERDHPSEWLDKHYKQCNYVICVVGKKFRREWNDETRPNMPLVYAFHQLFNSLFNDSSEENHLKKIIVVLRNEAKDEKNIPSQYLQGARRFRISDVDGLARYMSGKTKYSFRGSNGIAEDNV